MSDLRDAIKNLINEFGDEYGSAGIAKELNAVLADWEKEQGWSEPFKGKPWTDDQLRVVLLDAPTKTNCVKYAKAFGRGYGAIEQIYRSFRKVRSFLSVEGVRTPAIVEILRPKETESLSRTISRELFEHAKQSKSAHQIFSDFGTVAEMEVV